MREDWDFFLLLVDGEPASNYLDLGLAEDAPLSGQPHMGYVRVQMRQPRPDGLSSSDEFEALSALEETLTGAAARVGATTYAGRCTSGGTRDFYFYTAEPDALARAASQAMAAHPGYEHETGSRPDPGWEVYFDFLYPSADDLQRILNRRVVEQLEANGDALSQPRPVDHVAYLPNAHAAAQLRGHLEAEGFAVDAPRIENGSIAVGFQRADRPDQIDEVVVPVARRVRELGGDYDGWGCHVVT